MASEFRWIGKAKDGESVTLRRFNGEFTPAEYATPEWMESNRDLIRVGAVVDVETTGLSYAKDQVIEIGLRLFRFNRQTGELLSVDESYSEFSDPGEPLSPEIIRLTGITDADVEGKEIDWDHVGSLFEKADLILAHNASFDRPFIDRAVPVSKRKAWGCSLRQIGWKDHGFNSSKLEVLSIYHGFFTDAHRALSDSDALLYLVTSLDPTQGRPYLDELLKNARRPRVKMIASQSPFESKDHLKGRGYRWDAANRAWFKAIYKEEQEKEVAWMESLVYNGPFKGTMIDIPVTDNFKDI